MSLEMRFWAKVELTEGCWLWTGAKNFKGYGRVRVGKKFWQAQRVAWVLANGPIPDGLMVCHHCDTPACCNPKHLFTGTALDNMRDMMAKGRGNRGPNGASQRKEWCECGRPRVLVGYSKRGYPRFRCPPCMYRRRRAQKQAASRENAKPPELTERL